MLAGSGSADRSPVKSLNVPSRFTLKSIEAEIVNPTALAERLSVALAAPCAPARSTTHLEDDQRGRNQ